LPSSKALPEPCKREGVPTATILPCFSDLEIDLIEKASNGPICEFITILGVNGFAWDEVNIKARVLDIYILLLRALEVHLDPRLIGIPKHSMTETSDLKVGPEFSIKTMQNVQVERRGDSLTVIIRSQKSPFVFHHVCTEQQRVSGSQLNT
jgi:hypothetical protein